MPTYDYACQACGHEFEKFQSITAPAVKKCPKCKKLKVKRLIGTGAGIIFKGSGFYQTDYRSSGYQSDAKKDTPATSDSTSSSESSKSDSAE
jgi:putative FmdB family regulatory protein